MNIMVKHFIAVIIFILTIISNTDAAQLSIPGIEVKSGQSFELPVMLDFIDNLAGVKLAMKYDSEILEFKKADKTKKTSSLMHIVNNKKPGVLIIVMAGAKGIKGKNFSILSLHFEANKEIKEKKKTQITINEVQLMSDKLKDIKYNIVVDPITILPEKFSDGNGAGKR